jgi:para-nitrobenzyl esterase
MRARLFAATGLAVLVASLAAAGASQNRAPDKVAQIDAGRIEGTISNGVLSFKGIPFAASPTGPLRWRPPQPVTPWTDVRPAKEFGADCVQKPIPGDAAASGGIFSEDCLFLNVWRPASTDSGTVLPVFVWIYGGGFLNGGSSVPLYDGSALTRQGLVVVSFNYRLGRLGFFRHPALPTTGEDSTGNLGFLDQLAALRWVQRNIAAFGGDRDKVTIVGESAGGISIMHHLIWPESRGLFHRAVVMSGSGRIYVPADNGVATLERAERSGLAFAQSMGIQDDDPAALAALRALPVERVNGDLSMEALLTKPATYAGGPILDGKVVTQLPGDALRTGAFARIAVLIGTTTDDLPALMPLPGDPFSVFGPDAAAARTIYSATSASPVDIIKNIAVDRAMHEPARFVATRMTAAGAPVWLYRFGYVADSLRPKPAGAEHSTELPYLFGTVDKRYGAATTAKDRRASKLFQSYIVEFAKHGDPNGAGLPVWPRFDAREGKIMELTSDATGVLKLDPLKARLDLVERASDSESRPSSWLDSTPLVQWNSAGAPLPAVPRHDSVDARCLTAARPAELDEDREIVKMGWHLEGAYYGGWRMRVIRATAAYDGMCRPRQYHTFVFVRGRFVGSLSPHPMDSRTDGSLSRVEIQNADELVAEYERYSATDALCCPSARSRVTFKVTGDRPSLQPIAATTSPQAR